MVNVSILSPGQARTRVNRRPVFPMAGIMKPFGLYPLMIHPVLPGETLQSASFKMKLVSRPVVHPFAGCWWDFWLTYVKFTDIDRDLGDMFVSDSFSSSGYTASGDNARTFVKSGQIDWVNMCLNRFHEAYFIHDNETARTIDGVPLTKLNAKSWMANLMFKPADEAVTTTDVFDQQEQLTAYQMMQLMGMTELTYEDYCKQFGVQTIRTGQGEPEILRYARAWTQPVNTIDPSDGSPSSAWVWNEDVKAEKPKRFDEPGFLLAVAALRPKMYYKYLQSSIVGNLWGFTDWFPIYNIDDPTAHVRTIQTTDDVFDPLANAAESAADMWYDHRDVLHHGEQFVNAAAADHPFAIPLATAPSLLAADEPEDLRGEYATLTDVNSLFVGTNDADRFIIYEGMGQLTVSGHSKDLIR